MELAHSGQEDIQMKFVAYALSAAVAVLSMATAAFAGQVVPEVDASSLSAGLGLLTAGVLMVRARRRSK